MEEKMKYIIILTFDGPYIRYNLGRITKETEKCYYYNFECKDGTEIPRRLLKSQANVVIHYCGLSSTTDYGRIYAVGHNSTKTADKAYLIFEKYVQNMQDMLEEAYKKRYSF